MQLHQAINYENTTKSTKKTLTTTISDNPIQKTQQNHITI